MLKLLHLLLLQILLLQVLNLLQVLHLLLHLPWARALANRTQLTPSLKTDHTPPAARRTSCSISSLDRFDRPFSRTVVTSGPGGSRRQIVEHVQGSRGGRDGGASIVATELHLKAQGNSQP